MITLRFSLSLALAHQLKYWDWQFLSQWTWLCSAVPLTDMYIFPTSLSYDRWKANKQASKQTNFLWCLNMNFQLKLRKSWKLFSSRKLNGCARVWKSLVAMFKLSCELWCSWTSTRRPSKEMMPLMSCEICCRWIMKYCCCCFQLFAAQFISENFPPNSRCDLIFLPLENCSTQWCIARSSSWLL